MKRNIILIIMLFTMLASYLFAAKSLERQGNDSLHNADLLFNKAKDIEDVNKKNAQYEEAAKKYEIAIAKYHEAITKDNLPLQDKINGILLDKLWKAYYFAHDYEKTVNVLKGNLKLKKGNNLKTLKLIKQICIKKWKHPEVVITLLLQREQEKKSYWAEKTLGFIYKKEEKYEEALKWFNKAYELKQNSKIISNIANLNIKLGNKKAAIEAYKNFLKTNPSKTALAKTYNNMGTLYFDLKDTDKALFYWEKSLSIKFNKDIAINLMVKYYDDKGNLEKALKKANLLLSKYPNLNHAIYYKAKVYYDEERKTEARKYFSKLTKNPEYSKIAKQFIKSIDSE